MNEQKKLTRSQFLLLVGGIALTAVVFKFSSVKNVISAVGGTSRSLATYGNDTYGGRKA